MEKWWLKAPENGWQLNTSHRLMQIPEEPKRLMKMLMDAGYEAFVVGGYVRLYPIIQPKDWLGNQSYYYKVALSSFGKTWFLTLEEAKRALRDT